MERDQQYEQMGMTNVPMDEPDLVEDDTAGAKQRQPRASRFLPWEEAKAFVRDERIPSRGKYDDWWKKHTPAVIPRYPYRVYKEWTTWNDFLGNENAFNSKSMVKWRLLREAIHHVHTLKIPSYNAWMDYVKTNQLPPDIPNRPDLVYKDWRSWNHWLGNKVISVVEAKQEAQHTTLFFIIQEDDVPGNVFTFGMEPGGMSAMKERWDRRPFKLFKMFWHNPEKQQQIDDVINGMSTPYLGDNRQRIVPNAWDLSWRLGLLMDEARIS